MIAILTNEKLETYQDITVLGVIGALLDKRKQEVISYKDLDFTKLEADETLYFIEHGASGSVGSMMAVKVSGLDNEGISNIIGQAIKKAGVEKCPKKIVLKICYSASDNSGGNNRKKADLKELKGMASMVRGVSMALAKYKVEQTTVTGYLGPAVMAFDESRKMYVQKLDAKFNDTELLEMQKRQNLKEVLKAELAIPDITKRARAVFASDALKAANKEFIEFQKKYKTFFDDGKGVVKETAKDGQKNL